MTATRAITRRFCGFTLIEMTVMLAVIAILAVIALPNGQATLIRAQITEAMSLADIAKEPIAEYWRSAHAMLPDNASAGLPVPDKVVNNFVRALTIKDGVIHITFGNHANGLIKDKTLTLRPAVIEDAPVVPVTWVCGNASAPDKMTIKGENRTDIPSNDLPLRCR